jgi:hypothetical protein
VTSTAPARASHPEAKDPALRQDASYAESRADVVGRVGAADLTAGTDVDLVGRVQANPPNFGSESATLYHAEKHYAELPASEQTGKKAANFLGTAFKTISSPGFLAIPRWATTTCSYSLPGNCGPL